MISQQSHPTTVASSTDLLIARWLLSQGCPLAELPPIYWGAYLRGGDSDVEPTKSCITSLHPLRPSER